MKRLLLLLCAALPACALVEGQDGPGLLPPATLRAAPDRLFLGEQELALRTYLWRDFQPIAPPDGKPLVALFWIYSTDSTALPAGLTAEAAWVVHGAEVWGTFFTGEEPPPTEQRPYQVYAVARDGPKWGPGVEVDVVVRLRDGAGRTHLLRAPGQSIGRTD